MMPRTKEIYNCSFRCYFPSDTGLNFVTHFQEIALSDIPKWIKAYQFTHPACLSVCVKIWLTSRENFNEATD
jgi:hypothetical protein